MPGKCNDSVKRLKIALENGRDFAANLEVFSNRSTDTNEDLVP